MYIKKSVLVLIAVLLIITTSVLVLGAINPFGFDRVTEFIRFTRVMKLVDSNFYKEVDRTQLFNGAVAGMTAELEDPYSGFLWGEDARKYMEEINGSYCGVGIYIENNIEEDTIQVVSAIAGSPAEEAGLTTGDKILKVDGTDYSGQEINEATAVMRGEEGKEVTLTILKKDGSVQDITLKRREIEIPSVAGEMLTDTVGRINLSQFTEGCGEKFREMYEKFQKEGMEALILDLRNNPGGLVDEAVSIAGLFVEKGELIVYTEDRYGYREEYRSNKDGKEFPLVILTNQGSASASEILTGALKDHGVGYQIGEKTYGKGVVQSVYNIGELEILSLTIARYFTPDGECIHEKGIEPDQEIVMDVEKYQTLSNLDPEEDQQLQAALQYLQK